MCEIVIIRYDVRIVAVLGLLLGLLVSFFFVPVHAQNRKGVWAKHGMVASQSTHATEVGLEILERGGNAVDAAVAASLALGVTEQYHSGIGGGGFILIFDAGTEEVTAIDAREKAPVKAHRDMFPGDGGSGMSREGPLAVGVPGLLAGLDEAVREFGTMRLKELIAPSVSLAREGFEIGHYFSRTLVRKEEKLKRHPETAKVYLLPDGSPPPPDHILVQRDLARTYERIAAEGVDLFYKGELGEKIARYVQQEGGLITTNDMSSYEPVRREPVRGTYHGYRIYSMPPPSSGGVHLVQMLNALEEYDLGALGFGSSGYVHLLAEVMKWAFRDRAEYLGDPDFVDVPVARLVSKEYAEEFRRLVNQDAVLQLEKRLEQKQEGAHTSHLSVVDRWGNAVAITQTVNLNFGSGLIVPGTGIVLNDEMDDFSSRPGVPNAFGLVGSEANAIAPGKRPLSSMTPTIVTKDGKVVLVLGSPGGPKIITSVLQVILNVLDFGMGVSEAVAAPRVHHQWKPDSLFVERYGFGKDVLENLTSRGHSLAERGPWSSVQAIFVDPATNYRFGAADKRLEGSAAGH